MNIHVVRLRRSSPVASQKQFEELYKETIHLVSRGKAEGVCTWKDKKAYLSLEIKEESARGQLMGKKGSTVESIRDLFRKIGCAMGLRVHFDISL